MNNKYPIESVVPGFDEPICIGHREGANWEVTFGLAMSAIKGHSPRLTESHSLDATYMVKEATDLEQRSRKLLEKCYASR